MSTLTVNVAGSPVQVTTGSVQALLRADLRSSAQFIVRDDAGTANYSQYQPVNITDSVQGLLFAGVIDSATPDLLNPNVNKLWTVICKDLRYLADKRLCTLPDNITPRLAGDIVTDLHSNYLAAEGVTATYALRHDKDATSFGGGTLTNVTAANGDIEIALAGTTVSYHDGGLISGTDPAIKFSGYASQGYNTNYVSRKIWAGSRVIASGDQLQYAVWIDANSPQIMASVDYTCTDGTVFSTSGLAGGDQQNIFPVATSDLSNFANNQWYSRNFGVSGALIGKTIAYFTVNFGGSSNGTYTAYFKDIIWISGGVTAIHVFDSTQNTLQSNLQVTNSGYSNVSATVVNSYINVIGNVVGPHSIDAAKIVKSSVISWVTGTAGGVSGVAPDASTLLETSIDGGATWQVATINTAIPNLQPGMNIAGRSMSYRLSIILGHDPTVANYFVGVNITVQPAYQATKTDIVQTYKTQADFNTGFNTNTQSLSGGGDTLNGFTRNWDDTQFGSQTVFGGSLPSNFVKLKQLALKSDTGFDVRSRQDYAGTFADFTSEVDIQVLSTASNLGIEYRTTNWGNSNGSYAYAIYVYTNLIQFAKGTNTTGAGSATSIATASLTLAANSWHRLKVVVSGTNHRAYIDDVLYINSTDATWAGPGNIALRFANGSGATATSLFDNFGVCASLTGTWQTGSAINLAPATTYGTSVIQWDTTQTPNTTSVVVQSSINSGSTWQNVTQGGAIPGLTPGQSLSGVGLLLRAMLTASNASIQPTISGITAIVQGQYNASGTRVAPALAVGSVGRCGSSSISWVTNTPAGTTLGVDGSLNGTVWTDVTASNGGPVPGINGQPDPTIDTFSVNTSANYTSTAKTGGTAGSWVYDTANSRIVVTSGAGTNGAVFTYNAISAKDNSVLADLDQSNAGGLVLNFIDTSNFYYCVIKDSGNGNTAALFKVLAGVTSQLGSTTPISFTHGNYRRFMLQMQAGVLTLSMDNATVITFTDGSPLAAGKAGLFNDALVARFYQIRIQPYGDVLTGINVYTRLRLASTDPTQTPQVTDLTASVRSSNIMSGVSIPNTSYQYSNTVATASDDLAKKSNYWWGVGSDRGLRFQSRPAQASPWALATINGDLQWATRPRLNKVSPLYRNRHTVTGGIDQTASTIPETKVGDGSTQTWALQYPVAATPTTFTYNGQPASIGVRGVDTNKQFYYQIGSNVITQDTSLTALLAIESWSIVYYGQIHVVKTSNNTSQQTALAAIDSSTGIVETVENVTGLNAAAAQQLADSRIAQYAILSRDWQFTTLRGGLAPGQILPVFVPEYGLSNAQMLITEVKVTAKPTSNVTGGVTLWYDVMTTEGPNVGSWTRLFTPI